MGGRLNHLALTVSDINASEAAFYGPVLDHLGFAKVEDVPGTMTLWHHAEDRLALNLWQARGDGPVPGHGHDRRRPGLHHAAFDAATRDEVDALHALLVEKRIAVLDPPTEYPRYAPGYYAVYFADPDGLKFELVHMPALPD